MHDTPSFGFLRRRFFPIHNHELKKFLPLSLIFFFISFNYALLRGWKDVLVIGQGGAEAIAGCKLWGVLPAFVLFNIVYSDISQRTGRIGRFNIVITYFLVYFSCFSLFFYPNKEMLELPVFASKLKSIVKLSAFDGLWSVIHYWPTTLFYIHSEAWGTFTLSILFYTFANEIVNTKQSGRFYPFLSIAANIGTILAGGLLAGKFLPKPTPQFSIGFVTINGILLMMIYTYFSRTVSNNPLAYEVEENKPKKKKAKLSAIESIKVLLNSKYLLLIGFIVFAYALCINLFEAIYKDYLRQMAHEYSRGDELLKQAFLQEYAGRQLYYIGFAAISFSLFLSTPAMKLGWRFVGSISPGMLLINCGLFLTALLYGHYFEPIANSLGISVALFALLVGLANVVFIKGSKYTFFDPFKENAYLPLTKEEKVLGKASVENLSRWGKALGSLFISLIINPFGGISMFRLTLGFIILCIVAVWLVVVQNLTNKFHALVKQKETEKAKATQSVALANNK